jgi:hypothetical protein
MKLEIALRWVILASALLSASSARAAESPVKSVDFDKARANPRTKYIVEQLLWPSKQMMASKQVPKIAIPEEMQKFKDVLKTVFRLAYTASPEEIDANAVAVESLRDANDCILLEFKRNGRTIRVEDGKALSISIFPDEGVRIQEPNVAWYIRQVALEVLNVPQAVDKGHQPRVIVFGRDIGASKCGSIAFDADYPPPRSWNSGMAWWCDGRNALFVMGKATFEGIDLTKMAAPPSNWFAPRKFKKILQP